MQGDDYRWIETVYRLSNTIKKAHGKPCAYCRKPMSIEGWVPGEPLTHRLTPRFPTRDHVIPKKWYRERGLRPPFGGTVMVCLRCNVSKGSLTLADWHARLARGLDKRAEVVRQFMIDNAGNEAINMTVEPSGPAQSPDQLADRRLVYVCGPPESG